MLNLISASSPRSKTAEQWHVRLAKSAQKRLIWAGMGTRYGTHARYTVRAISTDMPATLISRTHARLPLTRWMAAPSWAQILQWAPSSASGRVTGYWASLDGSRSPQAMLCTAREQAWCWLPLVRAPFCPVFCIPPRWPRHADVDPLRQVPAGTSGKAEVNEFTMGVPGENDTAPWHLSRNNISIGEKKVGDLLAHECIWYFTDW